MYNMFSPETYRLRREKLMQQVPDGLILIYGNGESPMNFAANPYPFRQDSNLLYFAGIPRPDVALLLDPAEGKSWLCGEDYDIEDAIWSGQQPSLLEWADNSGMDGVLDMSSLRERLAKAKGEIHYLPPYRCEHVRALSAWTGKPEAEIKAGSSEALIRAVVAQRSYKSRKEVQQIKAAIELSMLMHEAVEKQCRPGQRESHLAALAEALPLSVGGRLAYPIILTVNGQILHNHHHDNVLEEGRLLLCDMGAEVPLGYAGDITRTFPVADRFTERQKAIHDLVLRAEQESIKACKPGIPYRDIHLMAAGILTEGLIDLGLMQGDPREAVAAGAHALFFPHGLGHMLGLDVHDMESLGEDYVGYDEKVKRSDQFGLAYLRLGRALEPGFVLTVEPGIYFIPELIAQWRSQKKHENFIRYAEVEKYLDFGGVRIEDNVLITDSAAVNIREFE